MKVFLTAVLVTLTIGLSSCYTLRHQVGSGPSGKGVVAAKQWYALWGLVPISEVNTKAMADGAANYAIESQISFIDFVIGAFTGIVTIYPQTVTVIK